MAKKTDLSGERIVGGAKEKQTFCPLIKTICRDDCVFFDRQEPKGGLSCGLSYTFEAIPFLLFQIQEGIERIAKAAEQR